MMLSSASTSPRRLGFALMSKATRPATWGPAMLVPLMLPYVASPPDVLDRMPTPGADTLGFIRPLLSRVTGPRLLVRAMTSLLSVEPTLKDSA